MTTFGLASKKINTVFDDHRPLEYRILKSFSGLLLKTWLCFAYAFWRTCAMEITKTITPRILILAWLGWYADSRLLALSLSCSLNFEVCAVEPPCTRVEAETGDKALTSWWVVKLGRNQLWPMIYKFVWFIWLQLLCYFGCYVTLVASCIYEQLWIWSVCSYYVICSWNM